MIVGGYLDTTMIILTILFQKEQWNMLNGKKAIQTVVGKTDRHMALWRNWSTRRT